MPAHYVQNIFYIQKYLHGNDIYLWNVFLTKIQKLSLLSFTTLQFSHDNMNLRIRISGQGKTKPWKLLSGWFLMGNTLSVDTASCVSPRNF